MAGVCVAFGGPVLGAVGDQTGRRKPAILLFTLMCAAATAALWFVRPTTEYIGLALLLVGLGTITAEYAVVFYNAMLPELAGPDEVGRWSGWAWGLGYAGGLACLAVALFGFVGIGSGGADQDAGNAAEIRATAFLVAGRYLVFAVPLLLVTRDTRPELAVPRLKRERPDRRPMRFWKDWSRPVLLVNLRRLEGVHRPAIAADRIRTRE